MRRLSRAAVFELAFHQERATHAHTALALIAAERAKLDVRERAARATIVDATNTCAALRTRYGVPPGAQIAGLGHPTLPAGSVVETPPPQPKGPNPNE